MSTETTSSTTVPEDAEDDGAPFDWTALRAAATGWAARLTGPDRAAVVVVLVHLVPVAWLVVGGGLYLDDLRAQAYARGRSLWPFVVESNGTHLAPGARVVDWLQARYWPLEQWPAVVLTLVVHVALGAALWLLLRELVGPRTGAVVALTLGLLSPALVPMTAWFRQALTTGTVTVCSLLVMLAAARYGRRPSAGAVVAMGVALVAGLAFSERALAAAPAAVVLVFLLAARGSVARGLRAAAVPAVALAVLGAAYLAVYLRGDYDQGSSTGLGPGDALQLLYRALVRGVVPAMLGGPLRWRDSGPAFAVAQAPTSFVVVAWVLVLGLLAVGARRGGLRRRVVAPAAVALAYVLPVLAMVLVGRYAGFGGATGDDLRLYADCALALVVAGAMVLLGLRPASGRRPGRRQRPRRRRLAPAITSVLALAVAVSTVISWAGFAERWHRNPSPAYLRTLDAELDRLERFPSSPPAVVMPSPVPDAIIPGWFADELTTADLVGLTHPEQPAALADGRLLHVDPSGRLSAGAPLRLGGSAAPRGGFCGTPVPAAAASPVEVSLVDRVPYYRGMVMSLQVLTNVRTVLTVDVVDGAGTVRPARPLEPPVLDPGPHTVLLPVPYGTDVAGVRVHPADDDLCVPRVTVLAVQDAS